MFCGPKTTFVPSYDCTFASNQVPKLHLTRFKSAITAVVSPVFKLSAYSLTNIFLTVTSNSSTQVNSSIFWYTATKISPSSFANVHFTVYPSSSYPLSLDRSCMNTSLITRSMRYLGAEEEADEASGDLWKSTIPPEVNTVKRSSMFAPLWCNVTSLSGVAYDFLQSLSQSAQYLNKSLRKSRITSLSELLNL